MDKFTDVFRSIIIDYCIDAFDIKTSACQICSNEDLNFPSSELTDNFLSHFLSLTTMILTCSSSPHFSYSFNQRLTALSFIYKNNDWGWEIPEDFTEPFVLWWRVNQLNILFDLFFTSSWFTDSNIACIGHKESLDHFLNLRYHGGAEHMNNFFSIKFWRQNRFWTAVGQNVLNLFRQILRDHFISLIDDNPRQTFKWQITFFNHFLDTPRSANDNVSAFC